MFVDVFIVKVLEIRQVVVNQCFSTLVVLNHFANSLQGVCFPVRNLVLTCQSVAAYEVFKFFLFDVFLCVVIEDTTRSDIIVISQ